MLQSSLPAGQTLHGKPLAREGAKPSDRLLPDHHAGGVVGHRPRHPHRGQSRFQGPRHRAERDRRNAPGSVEQIDGEHATSHMGAKHVDVSAQNRFVLASNAAARRAGGPRTSRTRRRRASRSRASRAAFASAVVAMRETETIIATLIGVATTTRITPRKISFCAACGSSVATNCGRNVTKNMMIFGFRRLTVRPVSQLLNSGSPELSVSTCRYSAPSRGGSPARQARRDRSRRRL